MEKVSEKNMRIIMGVAIAVATVCLGALMVIVSIKGVV